MRFEDWEPIYLQIVQEFGYSRAEDDRAAVALAALIEGMAGCDDACLSDAIGREATVCGNGPNLERDLGSCRPRGSLLSADGATRVLMDKGLVPSVVVTDLDGEIGPQARANAEGSIAVIHAHGDNLGSLRRYVPRFQGRVVGTTQSTPFDGIRNYGGFTDGDRAVMLARHFGAKRILLLGFDFERPMGKNGRDPAVKARKLRWAKRLIYGLNPQDVVLSTP